MKKRKILLIVFIILSIGLLMVYSSSHIWAQYKENDSFYYFKRQAIFVIVGLLLLFFFSNIYYKCKGGTSMNNNFTPEEKLYYTDPTVTHSDETEQRLPKEDRQTWQYLKGAKKLLRTSSTGHEYVFSEGAISMIDQEDKPARTMLTSEGGFSRTTHIVKDKMTGRVRLLTATEAERIQGFPTDHTKYCLVKGETVEMPLRKRRFMMGNALVVNLVEDMEKTLSVIFNNE